MAVAPSSVSALAPLARSDITVPIGSLAWSDASGVNTVADEAAASVSAIPAAAPAAASAAAAAAPATAAAPGASPPSAPGLAAAVLLFIGGHSGATCCPSGDGLDAPGVD